MQTLRCILMPQFPSGQAPKCLGETLLDQVPYNSVECLLESRAWSLLATLCLDPVPGSDSALLCDKLYVNSVVQHTFWLISITVALRARLCGAGGLSH